MPTAPQIDPQIYRHRDLEQIALASLACARVLMETGSRAMTVHECCRLIATGLGADIIGVRVGYASISVTLRSEMNTITRMVTVPRHGMDHRLNQSTRDLVAHAAQTAMPPADIVARLEAIAAASPHHPAAVVVIAVGLACAAFGALLGTDTRALAPIFLASAIGQFLRRTLLGRQNNAYVVTAITAFAAAFLCGTMARAAGSATAGLATIASTLLLVPGVPATNGQADILDGLPTIGSARVVSMLMTMVFVSIGILCAQGLMGLLP